MLYEMATGRPPYDADTPMAVVVKHINDPLPPPRKLNPALPESVERVILKALAKERDGRYRTTGEMAKALETAVAVKADLSTTLPEPVKVSPAKPWKKHRVSAWVWAGGCLGLLILLVATAILGIKTVPLLFKPTNTATALPVGNIQQITTEPSSSPAPKQATKTLTPTQPTKTPTPSPKPQGTPAPIQRYRLPFSEPQDVVSNAEGLWVLFASRLVKLELVEGENRFRAVEQIEFPGVQSLDWDIARGQYWAICGSPYVYEDCQEEIELINQDGNVTATFTTSQTFDGSPTHLAWDGEYLWLTSLNGTLYKLQPTLGTKELKLVDSFGLSLQWGGKGLYGLAWDGTALWLLDGDILTKLDSSAQPVCRITMPSTMDTLWWQYLGITWDGQFLWVIHTGTNNVYRVDPALCE
jgi:hypothetical protein